MEKEITIHNWIDRKIEKAKNVIEQFQEGNHLVDFRTIETLSDEWQPIAKDVLVRVIFRSTRKIVLQCKMEKGAILLIHAHPDYLERFRIKEGILLDKESNSILDKHNGKTFKLREYHTMIAVQKADMEIDCLLQP